MSKTNLMLTALKQGQSFTSEQAVHRFNFANMNTARAQISKLRFRGYTIDSTRSKYTKYKLGTPSLEVVAAGYRVIADSRNS